MGKNELSVINQKNELIVPQESLLKEIPLVFYSSADDSRYVFETTINDTINISAFESDQLYDHDEFVGADFDDEMLLRHRKSILSILIDVLRN